MNDRTQTFRERADQARDQSQGIRGPYFGPLEQPKSDIQNLGDLASAALAEYNLTYNGAEFIYNQFNGADPVVDLNFNFDELSQEEQNQLLRGLPKSLYDDIIGSQSRAHAEAQRQRYFQAVKQDQDLAEWGWTGFGAALTASIIDPVAWGAVVASEGLLAPVVAANKASRLGRISRFMAAGAVSEGAIEGALALGDPTRGLSDILFATAGGLVLGGLIGSLTNPARRSASVEQTVGSASTKTVAELAGELQDEIIQHEARKAGMADFDSINNIFSDLSDPYPVDDPAPRVQISGSGGANLARSWKDLSDDEKIKMWDEAPEKGAYDPLGIRGNKFFGDLSGVMSNSLHAGIRWFGTRLVPDPTGKQSQKRTVWEDFVFQWRDEQVKFYRVHKSLFRAWKKQQRYRWWDHYKAKNAFDEEVGRRIRRDQELNIADDDYVSRAADYLRDQYEKIRARAEKAGVEGFDQIPQNPKYVPRVWRFEKIQEFINQHGKDALYDFLGKAIQKVSTHLDMAKAHKVARAVVKTLIDDNYSVSNENFIRGFSQNTRDKLKRMLVDEFGDQLEQADIEDVLDQLVQQRSTVKHAQHRLGIDEIFEAEVPLTSGEGNHLWRVDDLFENNAANLFESYSRLMSAHTAFAHVLGFTSPGDFDDFIELIKKTAHDKKLTEKQLKEEIRPLIIIYNTIMGRPQKMDEAMMDLRGLQIMRIMTKATYLNVGGMIAFAQVPEIALIVTANGIEAARKTMPDLHNIMGRSRDGSLDNVLGQQIEDWLQPLGYDRLINNVYPHADAEGFNLKGYDGGYMDWLDDKLEKAVSLANDVNGMNAILMFNERFSGMTLVQRWYLDSIAEPSKRQYQEKHLNSISMTQADADEFYDQMKKHAAWEQSTHGGRRLTNPHFEKWDDQVREKFKTAFMRSTNSTVIRSGPGDLPFFFHNSFARMILQFRSFQFAGYSRLFLRGLSTDKARFAASIGTTSLAAALAYSVRTHFQAIMIDDPEKQRKFREQRFDPRNVAAVALNNGGMLSVLPEAIDIGLGVLGHEAVFTQGRYAVNPTQMTDIVSNFPALGVINKGFRGVSELAGSATRADDDITEEDLKKFLSFMPLYNSVLGQIFYGTVEDGIGATFGLEERDWRKTQKNLRERGLIE